MAPEPDFGGTKATEPLNGPMDVLPPITESWPTGVAVSSARTWTCTVPSKATLIPRTVTGDATTAFHVGVDKVIDVAAAPSTHQVPSAPSWRTSTVVTGPSVLGCIGTSPDRESPWRKPPAIGLTMWR